MINTAKVKGRIVERGLTIQAIAPKAGCSAYTMGRKIANETPINLDEVMILAEVLKISNEEFPEFFLQ